MIENSYIRILVFIKVLYKVRHNEVREHIVNTSTKDQTAIK